MCLCSSECTFVNAHWNDFNWIELRLYNWHLRCWACTLLHTYWIELNWNTLLFVTIETAGPVIVLCARRRKLTPWLLMQRPKIMYGGGDAARALLVSVLGDSVNTRPVAERRAQGLLAKKGKITPKVNVRVEFPLQVHIFSGVLFALSSDMRQTAQSVCR